MASMEDQRLQALQRFEIIRPHVEARGVSNRDRAGVWYPAENSATLDSFVSWGWVEWIGKEGPLGCRSASWASAGPGAAG